MVFWHDDVWNNKELVPRKSIHMAVTTKEGPVEGKMVKIDDYTVEYQFAGPYASFPEQLAIPNPLTGPAVNLALPGVVGGIMPAHYMKQFHSKYTPKAELDRKAKDAKVDDWVALFKLKHNWYFNTDLPCFTGYKVVSPINTSTWVVERNPYFYQVDTAGNQLPYTDRIVLTLAEDIEVLNLRAIAGEFDYQDRHIQLAKLPVFLQNEKIGNYKVWLDPGDHGSICSMIFNNSFDKDPEIQKWILNIDFRKALSMAMDRDQLNEAFFAGLGTVGSGVPLKTNPFYPGDQYFRPEWINFNLQKANETLDKLGLDKKDSEGYRLRTDGKGRLQLWVACQKLAHLDICAYAEMIGQMWKKAGIYLEPKNLPAPQVDDLTKNNEIQITMWENSTSETLFEQAGNYIPVNWPNTLGPEISKWFDTGGKEGKAPPPIMEMEKVVDLWRKGRTLPREDRVPLGKEMWKIMTEKLYHIGTVGFVPVSIGIHVVKTNLGNVQRRTAVSFSGQTPGNARPQTYYWKS